MIGTSEIRYGRVVHVSPCEHCEDGRQVWCIHGGNCDCPGTIVACATCEGAREVVEEDCTCERCVLLWTTLQRRTLRAI